VVMILRPKLRLNGRYALVPENRRASIHPRLKVCRAQMQQNGGFNGRHSRMWVIQEPVFVPHFAIQGNLADGNDLRRRETRRRAGCLIP